MWRAAKTCDEEGLVNAKPLVDLNAAKWGRSRNGVDGVGFAWCGGFGFVIRGTVSGRCSHWLTLREFQITFTYFR
jgi:hypothetical protein